MGCVSMTTSFGPRINNMWDFHDGIDLPVPIKTPVLAVRDSVVYLAGEASTRAWGSRHIVLKLDPLPRHSDLYAVYLHLARIEIPVDRRVRQGQRIGWAEIDGALLGGSSHRTTEATCIVRGGLAFNAVPALPDAETVDRVESLRGWT